VIADVIIIYFMGSGGYVQIQILADNVNIAAGFSLLPFLIVPSKLSYWWSNRQRIWQEYVKEPPLLFGRSLWTDPSLSFVADYLEGRHLSWCIWYPGLLACFFTIQVLVPVALLVFPLLSIPAFLVKMDSLPRLRHAWAIGDIIPLFGVLNQVSKVWDTESIEKTAIMGFLSRVLEENQETMVNRYLALNKELLRSLVLTDGFLVNAFLMVLSMGKATMVELVATQLIPRNRAELASTERASVERVNLLERE